MASTTTIVTSEVEGLEHSYGDQTSGSEVSSPNTGTTSVFEGSGKFDLHVSVEWVLVDV
jgi:hypothetical protein